MTTLLSLPTELIVLILSYSTAQTATRLARANKELRAIWIKHNDHIVNCIIKNILPASAYQDALELGRLQRGLLPPCELIDATYFGRILHDATLAAITIAACDIEPHTRVHTDRYCSYYFVRKLVLAGRCHQKPRPGGHDLKQTLYSALIATSTPIQTISFHVQLCSFMYNYARARKAGLAHSVWALEKHSDIDDESDSDGEDASGDCEEESDGTEAGGYPPLMPIYGGRKSEWKYADEVLMEAWWDRYKRTQNLKKLIFKDSCEVEV
jgi:hypothetical protein